MTALAAWAMWGGVALGVAAGVLLLRALFADRPRGRRRCPKCWYLMDGVVTEGGLRCPECGHAAKSVRALQRTRRRWGWATLACLLGVVAYGVAVTPRVVEGGWRRAVPSTLLVSVWPMDVEAWVGMHLRDQMVNDAMLDELDRRVKEEELTRWQERWWVERVERWVKAHGRLGIEEERPVIEKLKAVEVNWTFNAEPLEAVMKRLSREIGVPVRVEWDALVAEGVRPEGLVSGRLEGVDGLEAVDRVIATFQRPPYGVSWRVTGDFVRVGVFDYGGDDVPIQVYDVGHLLAEAPLSTVHAQRLSTKSERVEEVMFPIIIFVQPEEWLDGGGRANSLAAMGTHVLVRAPANCHQEVEGLLGAMTRAMRTDRTVTSTDEPSMKAFAQAYRSLTEVNLSLQTGLVSLEELVARIGEAAGLPVHVDWESLANVRVRREMLVEIFRGEMNASQALDRFLRPLVFDEIEGVSWTISRGAIHVGRERDIRNRKLICVYNVADFATYNPERFGSGADEVRHLIESSIDPEGWVNGGGDTGWALPLGSCLIVQTTPRNHLAIEHLLATLRAGPPKRAMSTPATEPEGEAE